MNAGMSVADLHARAARCMRLMERLGRMRHDAGMAGRLARWDRLTARANRMGDVAWDALTRARRLLYEPEVAPNPARPRTVNCGRCRGTGRMGYIGADGEADVDVCDCVLDGWGDGACGDCGCDVEGGEKIGGTWFCRACARVVRDDLLRYEVEAGNLTPDVLD